MWWEYGVLVGRGDLLSDPLSVRVELVAGESDSLDSSLEELGLQLRNLAQLGGADGSEIAAETVNLRLWPC